MTIALTDTRSKGYENYLRWVQSAGHEIECLTLSAALDNLDTLNRADGVLLTGGGDVDPALYGRDDARPLVEGVDKERDRFELSVIARALEHQLPLLCICRGMQLFNVARGGTLIPDLLAAGYKEHRKGKSGDRIHEVTVEANSILSRIVGLQKGVTNTNHHQAADRVGEKLRVTARSSDGVIEAMEWEEAATVPFLQLVQWHPERMSDPGNPLSQGILRAFLQAVQQHGSGKKPVHPTTTLKSAE